MIGQPPQDGAATGATRRYPYVGFRPGDLLPRLEERAGRWAGSPADVARRDLGRYYDLLERERATLRFTAGELCLVCDALNGTAIEGGLVRLLWAEVQDAAEHGALAAKWGVNGSDLVERLRTLTPGQAWALVDGVERFWAQVDEPPAEYAEQLRRVGFPV